MVNMDQINARLDEISEMAFTPVANGIDPDQVNGVLDEMFDFFDQLTAEITSLQQQLTVAKAARPAAAPVVQPMAPVAQPSASVQALEILEQAQKIKGETLAKAEAEAKDILDSARAEAEKSLGDLTGTKASLETEIASLKQVASNYRQQFESLLAAQQDALDKAANLF